MSLPAVLRLAATALAALATPVAATAGGPFDDVVTAEIRGGWQTERNTRMAALHLRLAPGWKTYWRAPGDAGIPPTFSWGGSDNLKGVSYHWPRPDVFESYGMRTIGYSDELVLPIELHPRDPGAPIRLRGVVDIGVCETICVPARLDVAADLSGAGASDPTIRAALVDRPVPASRAGVRDVSCDFAPSRDGLTLTARIEMPRLPGEEVATIETGDPRVWVSEPEVAREGETLTLVADLVPPAGATMALDRSALRFTVLAGRKAVDVRGCAVN